MKNCPNCNAVLDDNANFCANCGASFTTSNNQQTYYQQYQQTYVDPYDHTSQFDATDIANNKVFAAITYLLGVIGIIIALLGAGNSEYVKYHIRQSLRLIIVEVLLGIIAAVTCWLFVTVIAVFVCLIIVFVLKIICVFQVFAGKAKDAAIIRGLKFLY